MPDVTALALVAALVGDPVQGQAIASSRSTGLCVLCHAMPGVPAVHSGNIGPDLAGVGARYPRALLRERLLMPERFNPQTVMPAPLRSDGLQRVAAARAGQGVLTPQQTADVLAWLETLQ
ncbi:MAG: sulfur oxidation c-type cytochrome SoxX [Rubrivivax sp.]|nr:sulfur oxidation c-type cytochrome SoxX [Rubrivivax sp.]